MSIEFAVSIVAISGVVITSVGLIASWRQNGRAQAERDRNYAESQATRDAKLEGNQEAIIERLDDRETGLQAVNIKIGNMQTNCAKVSTSLQEQVKGHDRELKDVKQDVGLLQHGNT